MRPKFLFLALIAFVFYLLGARAGQDRYEEIMERLTGFWTDPEMKKARAKARKQAMKARKAR